MRHPGGQLAHKGQLFGMAQVFLAFLHGEAGAFGRVAQVAGAAHERRDAGRDPTGCRPSVRGAFLALQFRQQNAQRPEDTEPEQECQAEAQKQFHPAEDAPEAAFRRARGKARQRTEKQTRAAERDARFHRRRPGAARSRRRGGTKRHQKADPPSEPPSGEAFFFMARPAAGLTHPMSSRPMSHARLRTISPAGSPWKRSLTLKR